MPRRAGHSESIPELVTRLVGEGRDLVSAEVALGKARLGERISSYKSAAIFFCAAGALTLAAMIALLVGLILWLAPVIGPGLATAAVVVVALLIAGVLALIGKRLLSAKETG